MTKRSKEAAIRPTPQRRKLMIPLLPPSTNHSHIIARRGNGSWRIRTHETVAFMETVHVLMAGMVPLEGPVAVSYTFHFADRRRDVENALKVTSDAISATGDQKKEGTTTGYLLHNDRQIEELHAYKKVGGNGGILGVEVEAWTL